MTLGARATIRLDALTHNFELLKSAVPDSKVLAAVKANAYGHGLTQVAGALRACDAFAVARLVEARRLREAGIDNDIVLMAGVIDADDLAAALSLDCHLVVHSEQQVSLLESAGRAPGRCWLKVDTGMHRLGVAPSEAPALLGRLESLKGTPRLGLMTHLANADDVDDPTSMRQLDWFLSLTDGFEGDLSIANSAALLGWASSIAASDRLAHRGELWIRPGISLYGISPLAGQSAFELGLRPVMHFATTLVAVKVIKKGARVGYGGRWQATTDTVLGIAAAGYGDGYSRWLPSGTPVLVNGRRTSLAGVVSMDLIAIDLGSAASDLAGDPVTLWGDGLPVEEVAGWADTTAYPLVTGVIDRDGRLR